MVQIVENDLGPFVGVCGLIVYAYFLFCIFKFQPKFGLGLTAISFCYVFIVAFLLGSTNFHILSFILGVCWKACFNNLYSMAIKTNANPEETELKHNNPTERRNARHALFGNSDEEIRRSNSTDTTRAVYGGSDDEATEDEEETEELQPQLVAFVYPSYHYDITLNYF